MRAELDDGKTLGLRADEWVQVRTAEEIFGTLDGDGRLDALPFMPEMLPYCGKTMRVGKRAHKTCDPSLGVGGRKMARTVHLENIRCNGSAHDQCEAGCLIFWKEAWLKRVDPQAAADGASSRIAEPSGRIRSVEDALRSGVKIPPAAGETEPTYVCQNTQIKFATQPLKWWDIRQYWEDYTSGNVRLSQLANGLLYSLWRTVAEAGIGLGSAMRWSYDRFQRAVGGSPYPVRPFGVPKGTPVPRAQLDLKQGEIVRVKPFEEILPTLDSHYRNRGLYFDVEMVPFTGRTYEVERRQSQIIDEGTGKMVRFKTDAIILKDVVCQSRYSVCRRFCPRAIYPYWREIWLERAAEGPSKVCKGPGESQDMSVVR
ncbi:MAG: hypothetical protein HXX15_13970 [Rhodopseudomonas sp.]|uniref:hypothetical protein n=1 Tax=Rhodopseudomonas sp. TaxID=1078 RepID=UPI0017A36FFE|nr:hypothetical protein [Rhodopseudomonas sp.]NVN87183.1 hypothetical protein [Rhodopseudomonas sp.]